jgi:hypothetical protein
MNNPVITPAGATPSVSAEVKAPTAAQDKITSTSYGYNPRTDPPQNPSNTTQPTPQVPPLPPPVVTLQDALDKFVSVVDLPDAYFACKGVCTKCGWQTMQLTQSAARDLVRLHVQSHWRDVAQVLK